MKVTVSSKPVGKLVAVVGAQNNGLFLEMGGQCYYLDHNGLRASIILKNLEDAARDAERTPVYEGETVTIQF